MAGTVMWRSVLNVFSISVNITVVWSVTVLLQKCTLMNHLFITMYLEEGTMILVKQ